MSRFVQSLENRMFLSVSSSTLSADLAAVRTDAGTLQKDAGAARATLAADLSSLSKDVRPLKVSSDDKLLATLGADNARGEAKATVALAS